MIDFIRLDVEPKYLKLHQGSQNALSFQAYVTNYSQDFHSFYLELIVPGITPESNLKWYSTEPQVAAKKPPGATTEFTVNINRSPRPSYENPLDVTVRAIAIENPELFATETLNLKLEAPLKPLTLSILTPRDGLKGYPGEIIEIPVIVSNFSQNEMAVTLIFKGEEELKPDWMIYGSEIHISQLNPGEPESVIFECKPPEEGQARSQTYNFTITAKANRVLNPEPEVREVLKVLPKGIVAWDCDPIEQVLSRFKLNNSVDYTIKLENKSNLLQDIYFDIVEKTKRPHRLSIVSVEGQEQELFFESDQQKSHYIYTGLNFETIYPKESGVQKLKVSKTRAWLGMGNQLKFKLKPYLSNPDYNHPQTPVFLKPETQTITLDVKPIIPFWLQLLVLLLLLLLGGLLWLLRPKNHHNAPVNSVAFDGNANTVISGSSDRTIRSWQVVGNQLHPPEVITDKNEKAVRVVRFSPEHNRQVAAGLETGEINLWNINSRKRQGTLCTYASRNDRVFDLEFTKDSRYLLSTHGSGIVRVWDLEAIDSEGNCSNLQQPPKKQQRSGLESVAETYNLFLDENSPIGRELILKRTFSLLTLTISEVRNKPRLVFFAGQYNQLVIWENWENWEEWNPDYENENAIEDYCFELYYLEYNSPEPCLKEEKNKYKNRNKLYYFPYNREIKGEKLINQYNYITSLATHEEIDGTNFPNLLASADTEGYITLWNLNKIRQCIEQSPGRGETLNCSEAMLEQWNDGHKRQPVRTVALNQNGCYLASTGDDGRVMLWSLNPDGTRVNEKGKIVAQFPGTRLNSVDIKTFDDEIRLTFDGENHHVNIQKIKMKEMENCMNERRTR